ncbi:MAG: DUF4838 domain-containing protein [Firmicutes bacterium]|nr:DUF4838 domain-containing protein [Bacillota bacterium]
MAMVQTFFLGILLFFQSIFAPFVFDIPKGPVDYGGGAYTPAAEVTAGLRLFAGGASDYVIVVPDDAPQSFYAGARWINEFLNQMLGKDKDAPGPLPVVKRSDYVSGKCIALGRTDLGGAAFDLAADALKTDEGFVKMALGDNIFISGKRTGPDPGRAAMYGCADFIENELGCRWFTPTLRTAPRKDDIFIKADLNDVQEAKLDYRDDYWPQVYLYPEFKAFHKVNSFMGVGDYAGDYGRNFQYIGGFCHTLWDLVPRSLFDTQPELFAYRLDQKAWAPDQRCLTNPKVFELVKTKVFAYIDANVNDLNSKIVSVTQEDNDAPCQCERCLAMDALYGGPSGTNLWFTNKIADAVWEEYSVAQHGHIARPDILVDTFAYTYTVEPPTNIFPSKNVIVRMCSMGCCFNHPLRDCGYGKGGLFPDMKPHSSEFARQMKGWGALCKENGAQLYVWDYNTCFKFYPQLYPNLHVLADNLQFFVENGVRGVFEEGYDTGGVEVLPGSCSGEFGELRAYMLAKLLWNPYLNSNQLMDEFMDAYYGAGAAPYIKEFLDYYTNLAIGTGHISVFGRPEEFPYLNAFQCGKMDKLFDKAEQAASGSREQFLNVKRSRLSLTYQKANFMLLEFSWFNPCRLANNKAMFNESVMLGLDRFNSFMVEPYNTYVWLHRPYDWAKMNSWIDFVDKTKTEKPLDLAEYRRTHTLPY